MKYMNAEQKKITLIGAGSPTFAPQALTDILHSPHLSGSHIVLNDVDKERLDNITTVTKRYVIELGVGARISSTTDLKTAITGADFVLSSALAGGHYANQVEKQTIAKATGIYGPVEAHAPHRQLALALEIARLMAEFAPHAYLIQAANPLPEIGTLITRETNVPFIGICQGAEEFEKMLPLLGMQLADVKTYFAGINHHIWLLEFLYKNEDAYPILDKWIKSESHNFYREFLPKSRALDYQLSPAAAIMYGLMGKFPGGDTVRGNTPDFGWLHETPELEAIYFGPHGGDDSKLNEKAKSKKGMALLEAIQQAAATTAGSVEGIFKHKKGLQIVPIMDSIASNIPSIQQVNIPNRDTIAGLDSDLVIEVPALVDGEGAHSPEPIKFPPLIMRNLVRRAMQAESHVAAMQTGDERHLLQQYLSHPKVPNMETAMQILNIRKKLDPEMANHYKNSPQQYQWPKKSTK